MSLNKSNKVVNYVVVGANLHFYRRMHIEMDKGSNLIFLTAKLNYLLLGPIVKYNYSAAK